MGRYYTSEILRDPKLQKKAIDYALDKLNPAIQNGGSKALNQLSTKIRPNKKYTTNRKDLDGAGVIGDISGPTKTVSDISGKIIGGPTKKHYVIGGLVILQNVHFHQKLVFFLDIVVQHMSTKKVMLSI